MTNYDELLEEYSTIEGARIILRPITLEDAHDIYEYNSDEETVRYLYNKHTSIDQTVRMIENYYLTEPLGKYAVFLKEENKVIGTVEFRVHAWNISGELGFTLNSKYWGNGYMTEAGKLILQLAFEKLELARVFAGHELDNKASGRLLARLGMTQEGIFRKDQMIKGKLVDSAHYSILKEEYIA